MVLKSLGIFLSYFLFSVLLPSTALPLTIITEEFPPFNFTKEGRLTGVTTEVVQEIMRRQGISDPILVLPWARGYKRLKTEPDVVLFTTARTDERETLFHWVGPLYEFRLGFYARKGSGLKIDSIADARKVKAIATYKDDFREQMLLSMGFANLDSSNSPRSNLLKLVSDRVDLWFFDNIGAPMVAHEAGVDPNAIEEILPVEKNYSYIAVSKQTPESVVRQWQQTLNAMKADGSFWWITRHWLSEDAVMRRQAPADLRVHLKQRLFTEDLPPSSYMQDGRITGFSVDIVRELLSRIGRRDSIKIVPWARGYSIALSEANVVLFSTTRLPQLESLFQWVGPLYSHTWGFYARKGSRMRIDSLQTARKVTAIGTYRRDAKMQYLRGIGFTNLVAGNRDQTNVVHLMRGEIDLWACSDFTMPHLVRQAGFEPQQFERVYPFQTVKNYIAFSKKTSEHVVRLWHNVLEEIKQDGTYDRIGRKYNYDGSDATTGIRH